LRNKITKCDQELERLTKERAQLEAQLAAPDIYSDAQKNRLKELLSAQTALTRETEKIEAEWLEASEQYEAAASEA
jgi:ATP-binding cassette subfamily F protein 3